MKTFTVSLENRQTEIIIDKSAHFSGLKLNPENSLLVTDDTMCKSAAARSFTEAGITTVVLGSGERFKTLSSIETIAEAAVHKGLDRGAVIIGLGGGVICDMAAFAASVYMRGCGLILVPTSLLAMVDASIGGKSGVDFLERKNLIGSFYPAQKVLIYTDFLLTLSDDEFKSGLAELIKHGFLAGDELLRYIEENRAAITAREPDASIDAVYRSLRVKAEHIEKDFRETGIRAHLNLGHTFGHALETAAGLGKFTHGEAVAWGIYRAMKAGLILGITDLSYAERVETILRDYSYNIDFNDFDSELYLQAISSDKKKKDGKLRFILQHSAGNTEILPLDPAIVEEVIK
ncbi:MAG: 3-dehydroquinate synthase [Spirochaetales bacterium]|uniref:3-dehydroquinate synthase n=1 Tax=Candidatus Thalassospirochaeta sargassi TaxID=3119039 RepID=A0AAJ1IAA5_9SPIO|nr:3-dehydroquinate synthase [Spirochaetales bacterium]